MQQQLTIEEIEHLAQLANLELDQSEEERFAVEVSGILESVSQVQSLPIADLPATNQVTNKTNEFRPDVVSESLTQAQVMALAPKSHKGYIVVPAVIDYDKA